MSHSWSYFSHQNGSFLFSHKDLTTYRIKAPVRWGVNFKITPPRRSKPGVGVG